MNLADAKQKIKEAKVLKLNKLDLNSLDQLTKLNSDDLAELIPEIKEIEGLISLDLKWNKLSNADCLIELKELVLLDLSGNRLTSYDFLTELDNLLSLELNWDKLPDYKFLNKINCFTSLDLSRRTLANYDFLKEIKGLTSLKLSNNKLYDVSFLKELRELTWLDLSRNNLSDVSFLKELKQLTWLDLRNNKITNISFLTELKFLETFYLSSWYLELPKNLKQIIDTDTAINADKISQIARYYKQLEEQGKDYIYEAKVLVVGEPKAGKTTLAQKIKNNEQWISQIKGKGSKSTVGIVIDTLPFIYYKDRSKEITTHFWDFGGQDIQYVLHQYFFTESALYVLLADGRKELTNFNYWFEIIATLGKGSPVLVVLNENECKPIKTFNINEFRKEFGETLESIEERSVDFYVDEDGRFENLRNEIQNKVGNLKHIGQPLPKKWVDIRKDIEQIKDEKAYIDKDDYIDLCNKHELTDKGDQQQVLDYLHVLGIALNYKSDINLRNKLILKPNWVIDALYVVLKDTEIERNKGLFEAKYVDNLWDKEGYNSRDCEILLSLMQKGSFEIAYKLVNTNKFIVPILLPYKPIDYRLEETNPIEIKIRYKFLPKGIVSRLIVRLHNNIVTDGEQIVWNKGVLLGHHKSTAEVIEREQSKQILIKVVGENQYHNKELLTVIRNEIVGIHKDWFSNRLEFEELVPCICKVCKETDDKEHYKLSVLENALSKGKKSIECQSSFTSVNIHNLLEGIYIEYKNKEVGEFMGSQNTFHIAGNAQITTDPKDNVSITQNNFSTDKQIINERLDEMFTKLDEKQSQEMQSLVNEIVSLIDEKLSKENKLNDEQIQVFNEIKLSSDWKAKLKLGIPFNWFISQFTGLSFEIEKEWKISEEIRPESVISHLRKIIPSYELQQTEFNKIEVTKPNKLIEDSTN